MVYYLLIYDTGDMVFKTQKEAYKFAKYLRKKGHKIDRLQTYHNLYENSKHKLKIIKQWKR